MLLLRRLCVLRLLIPKILAEMAGTFAVIFVGAGSMTLSERFPHLMPAFGIPIAWGLIIAVMILAVGGISGAHFNPAVTLAFALAKKLPVSHIGVYWVSQCIGGAGAMLALAAVRNI